MFFYPFLVSFFTFSLCSAVSSAKKYQAGQESAFRNLHRQSSLKKLSSGNAMISLETAVGAGIPDNKGNRFLDMVCRGISA
jgi:hypothetical protein